MRFSRHFFALSCALSSGASMAQTRPPERTPALAGHPARVATFEPMADVRSFAIARVGDRALVTYVQAGDAGRGSLRSVVVRGSGSPTTLERISPEHTLAANALTLAVSWDGTRGAVAYIVPRPHRGEARGQRRRRRAVVTESRSLEDPLGVSGLTAGDVMLQLIDADGAASGRPVTVFEENSRVFRVALAPEGSGFVVAWTGAMTVDSEVQGTVRAMRVSATGVVQSAASDTGFTGQLGDSLRVIAASANRPHALIAWTGQRCASRDDLGPFTDPVVDPSRSPETRNRTLMPQQAPHEHPGPRIVCTALHLFTAESRADGTTGPVHQGPALSSDAMAPVAVAGEGVSLLAAIGEREDNAAFSMVALDAHGRTGRSRVIASGARRVESAAVVQPIETTDGTTGTQNTASRVRPPTPPGADDIARMPIALDAARDDSLGFVALSPTHARVVYGTQRTADEAATLILFAPGARTFDVALATTAHTVPWIFAQTGVPAGGPLIFIDASTVAAHAASLETPWPGDERLRQHLLRARAARAAYTDLEGTFGPLSERPDAATNPRLPQLASGLRRLRGNWDNACEPLLQRARWLARHGADADIVDLALEQCELPGDPVVPPATGAVGGVAAPGSPPAAAQ